MRSDLPSRFHVAQGESHRALVRDGSSWCTALTGVCIVVACVLVPRSASAQPEETATDDEGIRPPPGTPGSTAADEPIRPPPGTPGSTAEPDKPSTSVEPSGAAEPEKPKQEADEDDFDVRVASRTFIRMFRRRYLAGFLEPGPEDETLVPIYEYASLRVQRVDAPWGRDSLDLRLSGWGSADMADVSAERRLTGDLMEASATARFGPAHVTLGRQLAQGGPVQVTRFDGIAFGIHPEAGLGLEGYGGLSVRPRFRQRREYVLLGSATDSLLRQPNALPDTSATDGWMAGGRASYSIPDTLDLGASFQERHERGELDRRWGAGDVRLSPMDEVVLGGLGTIDLDGGHLVEARGFADVEPTKNLTATAELLRTSPALFLSRGSVLSVFSLDTVTEAGGELSYRLTPAWTLAANGYYQWFTDESTGYRVGGRARVRLSPEVVTQVKYSRVGEEDLGYHAVRGSLSFDLSRAWTATTALQHYLYDAAIRGVDNSSYGSATLEFGLPEEAWRVMVGGTATRSPYATFEAEGIARLSIDLDNTQGGRQP
jgi:hypothetical protein